MIPLETIKQRLAEAAGDAQVQAEEDALLWIAKEATGSLRDAYTLFDQVVSFSDGHITLEKIREKLGLVGIDMVNVLAESMAEGDRSRVLELANEILDKGVSVEQFAIDLSEYFRSVLFLKSGVDRESIIGVSRERFSPKVMETFSPVQCEQVLTSLFQLFKDLRYSVNPRFELELVLSRISMPDNLVTPAELVRRIRELKMELTGGKSGEQAGNSAESREGGRPF